MKAGSIDCGETKNALYYELHDMEKAVRTGDRSLLRLQDACDVMEIMTRLRKNWGLRYPCEVW